MSRVKTTVLTGELKAVIPAPLRFREAAVGAPVVGLRSRGLPDHVFGHVRTMAGLHADNRYDRLTRDFEAIVGRPATSIRDYVANHPEMFGSGERARAIQ